MEKLSLAANRTRAARKRLERIERDWRSWGEHAERPQCPVGRRRRAHSIASLSCLKEEIEQVQLQVEQAKRATDLHRAAQLEYGTLADLNKKHRGQGGGPHAETGEKNLLREGRSPRRHRPR